jgi:hypothetical protein
MTDPPALSVIAASEPQSPKAIKAIWRLRVKPAMTGVTVISFCLSARKILGLTDPPALSVIAASEPQSPKAIKAIWRLRVKPAMTGMTVISFCLSACKI